MAASTNLDVDAHAISRPSGTARVAISEPDDNAMTLPRRQFLHLAAGAAALPAMSVFGWAQTYPSRPVRIMVGLASGGTTDIVARLIGQWLSERLGQQFIIENRPGAGSSIAVQAVVNAPPDGYTLLSVNAANVLNAALYENLNFNFSRDMAGSVAAPAARYRKFRRGSFILNLPLTSHHSITSSAMVSSPGGTSMPSARAV